MTRIVIAGAGAVGASIAYHLGLRGARDVMLVDRGRIAGGQTAKAFGGVRQQFSTAAEVMLAKESLAFFEELGASFFHQVGYLFLATSDDGLAELTARRQLQEQLGVAVEEVGPARIRELAPGLAVDDVQGGVLGPLDGLADPVAVTREVVARAASLGIEVREETDVRDVAAEIRVIACGPDSPALAERLGIELPIRPLVRQLIETQPLEGLPERLPLVIESETGFHFRRRGKSLVIAMVDDPPRWGTEPEVDTTVVGDRLERLGRRFPPAESARAADAWAGLYDMTPDAHPIIDRLGDDLYCACGFSGHGFMQSPAVGRAVAELILDGVASVDLRPYRLGRFAGGEVVPEHIVL